MQIRIQSTGQVVYEGEFRALFPNTSLPQQLTEALINSLGGAVVFEGPQAQPTRYQTSFADGVHEVNGKWFTKYSVADMDEEAIAALDAKQAESVREDRNKRLAARLDSHEAVCAFRYEQINARLKRLESILMIASGVMICSMAGIIFAPLLHR